jgi:hypothetical protein
MSQPEKRFVDVSARCTQTGQEFLMRFEQKGPQLWSLVSRLIWVGPLARVQTSQTRSKSASSPHIWMSGTINIDPLYKGCPHCEAINRYSSTFVKCSVCGNLGCSTPITTEFACPWCGNRGPISGEIATIRGVEKAQVEKAQEKPQLLSNNQRPPSLPPPKTRK